jgi:hypothetical protein
MGYRMGHPKIEPLQKNPVSDEALLAHTFQLYNQKFTWPGLNEAEERLLYTDSSARQLLGLAFETLRDEMRPFLNCRRDTRTVYIPSTAPA